MNAPLYNKLIEYSERVTSFHMPGHKFGKALKISEIPFLKLDATEVPGLDNLYKAEDVILEAENKMAIKYGAKETIFITNGSTSGISASILAVCNPGDTLIVARNCHHSVWNALILGGIRPIYIHPSHNQEHNILGGICPRQLEQVLKDNPEAKGVIIVSPTYEGLVSDLQHIVQVVHKQNKILIVDEAHGAHFVWEDTLPKSAITYGADIVVQSMHKTLPALTQSALVHLGTDKVKKEAIIKSLQLTQTSSPSYVMMGIMDYTRAKMESQPGQWKNYMEQLLRTRKALEEMENLILLSKDTAYQGNTYDIDQSKLTIFTYNADITGIALGKRLRHDYNIQVELEAQDYIIAMSTIADEPYELDLLVKALLEIDSTLGKAKRTSKYNHPLSLDNGNNMSPRKVYFGPKEQIPIDQGVGRISGVNLMLYPPGIPLICIGETFTKETIDYIKQHANQVLGVSTEYNQLKVLVAQKGEEHEG